MVHADEKSTDTIDRFLIEWETLRRFSPIELEEFTSGFSINLGSGASGDVYRGILYDGVPVAVKVLKGIIFSDSTTDLFKAEVSVLGKIHHSNVVKLYGFCFNRDMKALVYEFMENESLEKQLYGNKSIAWDTLYSIVSGTARGLAYLHEDCQPRVLHYDIKPANILLDSRFSPKVGDFGLAKLISPDTTHITESNFRGTPNYAAPELYMPYSQVTDKCDVYSYGVTLFDIIGRRRHVHGEGYKWFPVQVWKKFEKEKEDEIFEECSIHVNDWKQAKRILLVALHCVQGQPADRPSMSHVVRFLEGTEEVKLPKNPFVYMGSSSSTTEEPYSQLTLGPWGGAGNQWDDGVFAGIKKIKVFKLVNGDVRSIQVWYCGFDGKLVEGRRHGFKEVDTEDTIELDYPSEYLTKVTGFYDYEAKGFLLVRSLCFFSNKKQYGPFGDEWGIYFTSDSNNNNKNSAKDGKVVGFHGRDGWYLDAIGMHMEYNHREGIKLPKVKNATNITRLGPWGGGANTWDDGVTHGIKKIELHRGSKDDVRSIQIWYCGKDGDPTWSQKHGSEETHIKDIIELDFPSEYLVRLTGFHGREFGNSRGLHLVKSLCFFSNKTKYGPFGDEKGDYFNTEKDGKVVGFHGRGGHYLTAIGVHIDYSVSGGSSLNM